MNSDTDKYTFVINEGLIAAGSSSLAQQDRDNLAMAIKQSLEPKDRFKTKEDAFDWMEVQVDDPCVDNYRFAYLDDENEMITYENLQATGCCGFFDVEIMVDGRLATIGCNYGH